MVRALVPGIEFYEAVKRLRASRLQELPSLEVERVVYEDGKVNDDHTYQVVFGDGVDLLVFVGMPGERTVTVLGPHDKVAFVLRVLGRPVEEFNAKFFSLPERAKAGSDRL